MKKQFMISTLLFVLLISGCSNSFDVGSDFDQSIDFSTFRSYRWHGPNEFNLESMQYLASELTDERIRSVVDSELARKGIRLRENGPVDFYVNYTVTSEEKLDIDTYNTYSGYHPGWGYGGYGGLGPYRYGGVGVGYGYGSTGGTETRVSEYTQGTFVLDFIDPESDTLVWRGLADGKVDTSASQPERESRTIEVVQRVLGNFPPEEN